MRKSRIQMPFPCRPIARRALLLLPLLTALPSGATTVFFTGTSVSTNQSMWKPGSAALFEWGARYDSPKTSSSSSVGIGITCLDLFGCNGYDAKITGAAQIGIVVDVAARGGSVNASIPVSSNLTAPDTAKPGSSFNVHASQLTFGQGLITTTGSGIYAGAVLNLMLSAGFFGKYCAIDDCETFGSFNNLLDIDTTGDNYFKLFELNRDNNGRLEVANAAATYNLGYTFKPADFLSGTFQLPKGPNTQGTGTDQLSSTGSTTLVNLDFNVTNLMTEIARLPPLSGNLGGCCGLTVDYNLFSVDVITALNISQDFILLPAAHLYLNVKQTGERIAVSQADTPILFPDGLTRLDIVPEFEVGGAFSNALGICVQPTLSVSGLGGSLNVADSPVKSFGPLFHEAYSPGCFGGDIHTETFDLGGFSSIRGQTFCVFADTESGAAPVPEPATNVLVGLSLLLLAYLPKRRRGVRLVSPSRLAEDALQPPSLS